MKVGPGFCPDFLRAATSRTRCWPRRQSDVHNAPFPLIGEIPPVPVLFLPHQRPIAFDGTRVSANSAPAGAKFGIYPCGGSLPQKGKISGSPGFAKPGADQCLDPPALLAVTATPLAFGMIGDFPLRIAEEIPIPVSIQILTSSLVFQGGLPPVFRRIFALCPAFQRRVGYLPYPRGKSGTQGRQWLLLVLHSVGGMCFTSVFSATQVNSSGTATVFHICFQMRSSYAAETEKYISDASCGCATHLPRKKKC